MPELELNSGGSLELNDGGNLELNDTGDAVLAPETTLLDGRVATRQLIMSRSFSWDLAEPLTALVGQFFINTTDNVIRQNIGTLRTPVWAERYMNDDTFKLWSAALG